MIVFDASVLIAALSPSDLHHLEARSLLVRCDLGQGAMVHPINLAEVLVGPSRRGKESEAARAIAGSGVETMPVDLHAPTRIARLRAATGLAIPDCCALDAALETGYAIATFDHRLARAATSLGIPLAA
ncbi:MAG: type II toxin-antitoxin system VapC family toxin [Candidatus Nanopelagicales bacterium]